MDPIENNNLLKAAIENRDYFAVQDLLKFRNFENDVIDEGVIAALNYGDRETANLLIKVLNVSPSSPALSYAINKNDTVNAINMMRKMTEQFPEEIYENFTKAAIRKENLDLLRELIIVDDYVPINWSYEYLIYFLLKNSVNYPIALRYLLTLMINQYRKGPDGVIRTEIEDNLRKTIKSGNIDASNLLIDALGTILPLLPKKLADDILWDTRLMNAILGNYRITERFIHNSGTVEWLSKDYDSENVKLKNRPNYLIATEFLGRIYPSLLGRFLQINQIAEYAEDEHFRNYALSILEKGCYMQDDYDVIKDVIKNFNSRDEKTYNIFQEEDEEEDVNDPDTDKIFDLFKKNYNFFMKEKIAKYRHNQEFINFINENRNPITEKELSQYNKYDDPMVRRLNRNREPVPIKSKQKLDISYMDTKELLILADMVLTECDSLDLFRTGLGEKRMKLELKDLIEKHQQACLNSAYNMSLPERIEFIEKVWSKDIKNKEIFQYLENEEFMCSLIKTSLFCQDMETTFGVDELQIIHDVIASDEQMKGYLPDISGEETVCQLLNRFQFLEHSINLLYLSSKRIVFISSKNFFQIHKLVFSKNLNF